jgi:hypothetical protein
MVKGTVTPIIALVVIAVVGIITISFQSYLPAQTKPVQPSTIPRLGNLCVGEENCKDFCLYNRGSCEEYCRSQPENELCQKLLATKTYTQPQNTLQSNVTQTSEETCTSNPKPVFTSPFTDITKIEWISQIGSNALYNPGSQARSYVAVKKGEMAPVYAPVNATLTRIHYSNKNYPTLVRPEYRLNFQVSCEVGFAYDHIITVVDKLKEQAPQIPAEGRNEGAEVSIPVHAGELLGHTSGTVQAGSWDFLFLNTAREAPHINPARWISDQSKYADCPYDYFTDDLKKQYYLLIQKPENAPETCGPLVRDIPNTIAGYWFQGSANETHGARFGIYDAEHFVEFFLTKENTPFFIINSTSSSRIFGRDNNPSRIVPEAVTIGKSACYHDSEKNSHAYLKLLSSEELALVAGEGSCPSSFPQDYEVFVR